MCCQSYNRNRKLPFRVKLTAMRLMWSDGNPVKKFGLFILISSNFVKQRKALKDDKFHILSCRALFTCIINYFSILHPDEKQKEVKSSEIYNSKAHRLWCGKCFTCSSSTCRVSNNLFYRCFYYLWGSFANFVSSTFINITVKTTSVCKYIPKIFAGTLFSNYPEQ